MERIQAAIEKARAERERAEREARLAAPRPVPVEPEDPADPSAEPQPLAVAEAPRPASAEPAHPVPEAPPQQPVPQQPAPPQAAPAGAAAPDAPAGAAADVPRPHGVATGSAAAGELAAAGPLWSRLRAFRPEETVMRGNRIVAFDRTDDAHIPFDMMRTKLLRILRENGWSSIAVTSPGAGCGKTTTCLNLAFSLAHQHDTRTVLMDLDLRRPAMAETLGLKETQSMARILDGTGLLEEHFVRYGETLAIGTNARPARHPSELLQNRAVARALLRIQEGLNPEVMLFDLPPMLTNDDVMAFLPFVDCVLLVAAAEATTIDEIDRCERELATQTNVLGVIVNKCRYTTEKYGYY